MRFVSPVTNPGRTRANSIIWRIPSSKSHSSPICSGLPPRRFGSDWRFPWLPREAERFRADAQEALRGLGEAIDSQFARWGLTPAEREVGLLLLKGLSHKEAPATRATSETTIRQQALAIYRKSGLRNRSELSAFFLEDLLLPVGER